MLDLERLLLSVAGFLLLAASLVAKKKAGWFAVIGGAVLTTLAARESDPTLALGAFALVAARLLRSPRPDSPDGRVPAAQADGKASPERPPQIRS